MRNLSEEDRQTHSATNLFFATRRTRTESELSRDQEDGGWQKVNPTEDTSRCACYKCFSLVFGFVEGGHDEPMLRDASLFEGKIQLEH